MKKQYIVWIVLILLAIALGITVVKYKGNKNVEKEVSMPATVNSEIFGKYFEPHGAFHYIVLNADGTFYHNRINTGGGEEAVTGKFTLSGTNLKLVYDNGSPTLDLTLKRGAGEDSTNIYIEGTAGPVYYYFVKEQV